MKYITILFLFFNYTISAQQPDVIGTQIIGNDTFDIKGYKRIKPPPPIPIPNCNIKGIKRYLTPYSWGGLYLNAKDYKCDPGDTLVIKGNWAGGVDIENFHGTASCPIVIINEGSVLLPAGVKMSHCTYIKLTGSGTSDKYGFNVIGNGSGPAICIVGRSAFIDVERVYGYNKMYAAWVKEEATCIDSIRYPNWHLDNISIHDCKFVKITQDGFYLGSTSPTGQRSITCDNKLVYPIPMRLSNIRIYSNILDSCSRTGIQLSGADSGDNRIYNNTVTRCGYELNNTQGSGIILGGMTRARVYDNRIRQTFQHGIFFLGSGISYAENNDVDSSGLLGKVSNPGYTSFYSDTRLTAPANDSTTIIVKNNIFGRITADAEIRIDDNAKLRTNKNIISGNKLQDGTNARIFVATGIKWSSF
jgi:parallel beta-helix repeat protein